jgi:hypothetical protein
MRSHGHVSRITSYVLRITHHASGNKGDLKMQSITLTLPDSLYNYARKISEATKQPLEAVLQKSIAQTMPPLDDVPKEEAAELAAMAVMSDAALWQEARAMMSANDQAKLRELSSRQSAGQLSAEEKPELTTLLDLYGRLMVRKAHAWLLLARRGYQTPIQQD